MLGKQPAVGSAGTRAYALRTLSVRASDLSPNKVHQQRGWVSKQHERKHGWEQKDEKRHFVAHPDLVDAKRPKFFQVCIQFLIGGRGSRSPS